MASFLGHLVGHVELACPGLFNPIYGPGLLIGQLVQYTKVLLVSGSCFED